ncbi:MAG TPA: mechanosensitive ion channel domain-containing protein [Phycisphaerae bacterium]|nr:mechanosensitive ion channel domain-containing protein [Phycisphaerae bacterium]
MDTQTLMAYATWLGYTLGAMAAAVVLALLGHFLLFSILRRVAKRTPLTADDVAVSRLAAPTRWIAVLAAFWMSLNVAQLPVGVEQVLRHVSSVGLILLIAWLAIRGLLVGRDLLLSHYLLTVSDNLHARAVHTQIRVLVRILIALLVVIAFACVLMTFDGVRQLGASLLASAGILGIILGFAAQKVIGTLFAGLQMAITQPIRLEDVVIVEGEWGVIEEITLTYVVVRIWDLRRLVVPATYFMEKPFQNWTRTSASLLGTVFLYVDCTVEVGAIRAELSRFLEGQKLWDKKAAGLQVTNMSDRTVELRALMSAADASAAWDLRCAVREHLLEFLQKTQPHALPRVRVEMDRVDGMERREGLLARDGAGAAA